MGDLVYLLERINESYENIRIIEIKRDDFKKDSDYFSMLESIGQFRYNVWDGEGAIKRDLFPDKLFLDSLDNVGRHWVAESSNEIIASARLTIHNSFEDDYRDVSIWRDAGEELPFPTCDLGRLVVSPEFRRMGLAQNFNQIRIQAAREMGAKSIMVTASDGNAKLLLKLGFKKIGKTVYFEDRPTIPFQAMQMIL